MSSKEMYLVTTKIVLNQKTMDDALRILTSWEKHSEFIKIKNDLDENGAILFQSENLDEDGNYVSEILWNCKESFDQFLKHELTKEYTEWFDSNGFKLVRNLEHI